MKKTKKIYIVLTQTGTILSRIIKFSTKAEYAHVSLSLDRKLKKMYSFGRLNPYNPFIGGFVHEGIYVGTFKRFKNTIAEIYSIEVTIEQYNKIENLIKEIEENKEYYKFNFIGLTLAGINYRYKKDKKFYCAEFVKYLTDEANINLDLPDVIKPIDFKEKADLELLYKGVLKNYN